MKKIFFALAALVLAFTGCSQEEDAIQVSEKKAVKVVVNMDKPGFGEDTRAPRTEWVEGDEVVVTLAGQLTAYVKLTYQDETWENQIFVWQEPDGEEGSYVELTEVQSASFIEAIESSASTGSVMAVYFSSGVHQVTYNEAYVNIITKALTQDMGECIMTCKDGTYSASSGVLTLDITMIPQVAQYTIRNLNVEDGWNISIQGPVNGYAGGKITTDGVELTLIGEGALYGYPHQNGNDISIFAAPWQSNEDITDFTKFPPGHEITENSYKMPYFFTVEDGGANSFERGFDYKAVEIGDAVIFDGPYTEKDGEPTAGAQEWIY